MAKLLRATTVLALLAGLTIQAQTMFPLEKVLTWVPALTYETGGAFDESMIEHYDLYCDGAFVREVPNDFTRTYTATVHEIGPGAHSCVLSETVGGLESVVSNTVTFTLGQPVPRAPTLSVL